MSLCRSQVPQPTRLDREFIDPSVDPLSDDQLFRPASAFTLSNMDISQQHGNVFHGFDPTVDLAPTPATPAVVMRGTRPQLDFDALPDGTGADDPPRASDAGGSPRRASKSRFSQHLERIGLAPSASAAAEDGPSTGLEHAGGGSGGDGEAAGIYRPSMGNLNNPQPVSSSDGDRDTASLRPDLIALHLHLRLPPPSLGGSAAPSARPRARAPRLRRVAAGSNGPRAHSAGVTMRWPTACPASGGSSRGQWQAPDPPRSSRSDS